MEAKEYGNVGKKAIWFVKSLFVWLYCDRILTFDTGADAL